MVDDKKLSKKDDDDCSTCPSSSEDNETNSEDGLIASEGNEVNENSGGEVVYTSIDVDAFALSKETIDVVLQNEALRGKGTTLQFLQKESKSVDGNPRESRASEVREGGKTPDEMTLEEQAPEGNLNVPFQDAATQPPELQTTLTTVALRRQQGLVRRDTIPGAQHMDGSGVQTTQVRVGQGIAEQTQPEQGELVVNETRIIDEAFLVTPDEELANGFQGEVDGLAQDQSEGDNDEVIVGQVLQENRRAPTLQSRLSWQIVFVLAAVVAVAVFLAIFLMGSGNREDSHPTWKSNSEHNEGPVIYPPFRDGLPTLTLKQIEEIGGSVYRANKWMVQDPLLHTYSEARQLQRFILASTYFSLNGENWYNQDGWLDYNVSECDWFSNTIVDELKDKPICDEDNNLIMVNLANNNLQGSYADMSAFHSLPFLPHVKAMDVANNNISGATPALYSGVGIEIVVLSNNSFDSLSPSVGLVGESIRILKVDSNRIQMTATGVAWYLFPNLEIYNVTGNRIWGILGPQIKTARKLTYLGAGHNPWGGQVPSEIGLLTNLVEIDLSGNSNMEGTVPSELGLLTNLQRMDVTGTLITGDLPYQYCLPKENEPDEAAVEVLANCSMVRCCEDASV